MQKAPDDSRGAYPWEQAKQPSESARAVGTLLGPHVRADEDFRDLEFSLRTEVSNAEESGDPTSIYKSQHRLGLHLEALGRLEQAERAMSGAAAASVDSSALLSSHTAVTNDRGVILARLGRHHKAAEMFRRASEHARGLERQTLGFSVERNLGSMAWVDESPTAALDAWADVFRAARVMDEAGTNSQILNSVAILRLLEGEGDEALQLFNRAILLAQRGGDVRSLAFAYNNLGLIFSGPPRGDHIAAIPFVEMALALLMGPVDILARLYVLNNNILIYEQAHLEPARKFRAQFAESLKSFTSAYPHRSADIERLAFSRHPPVPNDLSGDDEWEISVDPVLLRAFARCGVQN
jgi:tetratricopeptide (TPR) repeat protein